MNYSGFMGIIYSLTEWITRFTIINILWTATNLPLIFIGFFIITSQDLTHIVILSIPFLILLPVLFFPSITSVFANVRDWIMNREKTSLIRTYLLYFKNNYKSSFRYGLILTVLWTIWIIDLYYVKKINDLLWMSLIVIGIILIIFSINIINVQVHYYMNLKNVFKNAFFLTVGKPLFSIAILLLNGSVLYISITRLWFVIPFFIISICAFFSYYTFYLLTLQIEKGIDDK